MTSTGAGSEELTMLRSSLRTLLEREGGVGRARALRTTSPGWDGTVMQKMAEAGVISAMVPEDAGGLGLGLVAAGVISEEIGRALAPEPITASAGLAAGLLWRLAPGHALFADLVVGTQVAAVAWQERGQRGVAHSTGTRFERGALTGAKAWVVAAAGDALLVIAQSDGGPVLALAAHDAAGLTREARPQADGSIQHDVRFSATPAETLAEGQVVTDALASAVADTVALAAAELTGISGRALEMTLDFLRTREQFGKPIGAFQAIQHRAVNMVMAQQLAEASVRDVLAKMADAAPDERLRLASRAKSRACTTAKMITRESIQMHGAIGYTDEIDIGLYLNRALVVTAWLGDATYHRRRWFDGAARNKGAL